MNAPKNRAGSAVLRSLALALCAAVRVRVRVPALLAALKKGGHPEGHYLTFREGMKKHLGNWFRIFNKNRRP